MSAPWSGCSRSPGAPAANTPLRSCPIAAGMAVPAGSASPKRSARKAERFFRGTFAIPRCLINGAKFGRRWRLRHEGATFWVRTRGLEITGPAMTNSATYIFGGPGVPYSQGNHAMRNHGGHHHKWSLIRRTVFAKLIAPARPAWSPLSGEELQAVDVAIQIFECLPHFVRLLGMSAAPGRLKFRNVGSLPAKTTAASEQIQRFRVFPGGLAEAEDRTTVDRSFRPGHQFSGVSETPDFRDDDAPRQDRVVDPQGHDRVVRRDAIDGQCSDRRRRHDAVVRLGASGLAQRRPGYPGPGRIEIEQPRLRARGRSDQGSLISIQQAAVCLPTSGAAGQARSTNTKIRL